MAINFPNSPTTGQSYTVSGVKWIFDGTKWTGAGSGPYVAKAGDTMGGILTLAADPVGILDAATKEYVDAKPAPPSPATVAPLMNGTAAVGTSLLYARQDHVHPSDTGVRYGDNRIINGNFAINQRTYVSGTALAAAAYGHDRWKAGASGCAYTFTATLPDTTITITANTLTQVIEASLIEGGVYTLSWTGTAQARVYQGTPTGSYAASPVITASLIAGTNTIVEFNAGTMVRVKLEIGSVATPFNRQSLTKSLADCQRYYQTGWLLMTAHQNATGVQFQCAAPLAVQMRIAPAVAALSNSSSNITGFTLGYQNGAVYNAGTVTAVGGTTVNCTFSANAEL